MTTPDLAPRRSLRAGVAAIATGLVVAGCGPASPVTLTGAHTTPVPDDPELASPLAPYMLSWHELTLVNHARSVRLSACLADAGYHVPVGSLAAELERARRQEAVDLSRLYGITDRAVAARNGYWPADVPPAAPIEEIPQTTIDRCGTVADRSVGRRSGRSAYGLARELLIASRSRLEEQPAAKAAIGRWVTCMARAGYRVTSPLSDRGDILEELQARNVREENGHHGPSRRERALATADIACKESTGLVARLERVGQALDRRAVRAHRSALVADRRRLDAVLARIDASGRLAVDTVRAPHEATSTSAEEGQS